MLHNILRFHIIIYTVIMLHNILRFHIIIYTVMLKNAVCSPALPVRYRTIEITDSVSQHFDLWVLPVLCVCA